MPKTKSGTKAKTTPSAGSLMLNVFDGTRQHLSTGTRLLVRIRAGNQEELVTRFVSKPSTFFKDLPFYNNFEDNYAIVVSADAYFDAGYVPIKICPNLVQTIDLMLLRKDATFNFHNAGWSALKVSHPRIAALLAKGAANAEAAESRYSQLMEDHPASLASFFNLVTAMGAINLPDGTPLDYLKEVIWDGSFAQDRFFGYADPKLIDQIKLATLHGEFAPEVDPGIFHGDATSSWKQVQFGEANVQLTFHEGDKKKIDGITCVKIEPDIDYYRDPGAHFFLEVAVNTLSHTLTDPRHVYVLRWIAGRHAGVPDFDPPYTIV